MDENSLRLMLLLLLLPQESRQCWMDGLIAHRQGSLVEVRYAGTYYKTVGIDDASLLRLPGSGVSISPADLEAKLEQLMAVCGVSDRAQAQDALSRTGYDINLAANQLFESHQC